MTPEREKEAVMAMEVEERSQPVEELLARIEQTVGQNAQASAAFGEPIPSRARACARGEGRRSRCGG